ncbi:hypothetical protein S7711_03673 [Stachybotrys chartarum IBT 7711]|uniref:Ferric oxidoreductase domain-containing protein n=1 Tax=Stachybotrys chartarum (strain CBS 109288 / IBT 7711) TaxID=1280523 RepID=A0A084B7H6_STACB|nr:hypothetical protein S7711_03673 [Stachybotrys chartarum IBT 7711]KFA80690.1 hypothetical protein S40288_01771 [Stachybotrys chartarum IBT 40288]
MKLTVAALLGLAALPSGLAQGTPRAHGTVGLGLVMYDPICAYMCRNSITGWMLDCPEGEYVAGHSHHGGGHMMPSPVCYANNAPFLQTLAWCIHTHCDENLSLAKIETYWERNAAGSLLNMPVPRYSYQEALARVDEPPTEIVNSTETLNRTSLIDEWLYAAHMGANHGIELNMSINNHYSLVLILTCSFIPVLLSLLRFLPFPPALVAKFYAVFIDPPALSTKHAVPAFFGLGIMPTRGQALFILYIWVINIVLSAVDYVFLWPTLWYTEWRLMVMCSIGNRVGMLSFANLALTVLFASRNNILLWITNWSRSTFVLVHRWLAVICVIQGVLHSILYFAYAGDVGTLSHDVEMPYYYWGIIGMVVMILILPLSVLPIRRAMYEAFLASHVVLSVLILVTCFLHIYLRYLWQWGYDIWVALAFALWAFDRLLARPLRLLKNGIKTAYVTVVDEDYLKVEIPGVEASGQAYLYFPTLTWRVWENHPFSVLSIPGKPGGASSGEVSTIPSKNMQLANEQTVRSDSSSSIATSSPGIVFFIRKRSGITAALAARESGVGIPVLVEASYGAETSVIPSPLPRPSLQYPNIVCIAGGVGISGILPILDRGHLASRGATKLYWSVRTEPLVDAVEGILRQGTSIKNERDQGAAYWGDASVQVSVGRRFDLRQVLEREIRTELTGGTIVVVCGPPGMSDEVRLAVAGLAKQGAVVRFCEERFGW